MLIRGRPRGFGERWIARTSGCRLRSWEVLSCEPGTKLTIGSPEGQCSHQLAMLIGGLRACLTRYRIDMLITVDVNSVIRVIGECDDFLHFCSVTGIREKGEQVLIDG